MQFGGHLDFSSNGQPLPNESPDTVANLAVAPESGHSRLARASCQTMLRRICAALKKWRWCQLWDSVMAKVATQSAQRIPLRKNGESCEYKKNGPRFNGGQVALVLSLCESLVGGLGGVAVGARMPRRKDEGLLRPIRASRGSNTLGWCSYLGRQTVCHQSYVHIACPHPRRLGVCIVG